MLDQCHAFAPASTAMRRSLISNQEARHSLATPVLLRMLDPLVAAVTTSAAEIPSFVLPSAALSTMEAAITNTATSWWYGSDLLLAATPPPLEPWVQPAQLVLDTFLNIMSLAMLARVVLSWYPEVKITTMPWLILTVATEPLLRAVKGFVPPAFGVDITPVFWVAVFTFVHEILLGQQGLLTLKIKYGI